MERIIKARARARVIALYLPQYYPNSINNKAWGPGFTEWTNVAAAKPLYPGHVQPKIPADLGFYDLRVPETRKMQADMARDCGVEGFCYWHYWFGNGKKALELPFESVLKSGEPDYPFCVGWANHSWSSTAWSKVKANCEYENGFIIEQKYPGGDDDEKHFNYLLPAFKDKRYLRIDSKPVFVIFRPLEIPSVEIFLAKWNKMAVDNGLNGIYFIAYTPTVDQSSKSIYKLRNLFNWKKQKNSRINAVLEKGYDAVLPDSSYRAEMAYYTFIGLNFRKLLYNLKIPFIIPYIFEYSKIMRCFHIEEEREENIFPFIIPNMDKSPREGRKAAAIYKDSTPAKFYKDVCETIERIKGKEYEHRVIFLRSWNEWGEGNYMEPDTTWKHGYINALKKAVYGGE